MNQANDIDKLSQLAQGRLAAEERLALAQRALADPALAADLKLALRLAEGSSELARDWVAQAQLASAQAARGEWWRPLAGVAASLAILAAVLALPRVPQTDSDAHLATLVVPLPDRIGEMSFEASAGELFGGSFEVAD